MIPEEYNSKNIPTRNRLKKTSAISSATNLDFCENGKIIPIRNKWCEETSSDNNATDLDSCEKIELNIEIKPKLIMATNSYTTGEDISDSQHYTKNLQSIGRINRSEGGAVMDNNELLSKYIDKVDRDQSDLRNDIRESEKRTSENIRFMEERMDSKIERIENSISKLNESIDKKVEKIQDRVEVSTKWINGLVITVILSVASFVIGTSIAIYNIVSRLPKTP